MEWKVFINLGVVPSGSVDTQHNRASNNDAGQ